MNERSRRVALRRGRPDRRFLVVAGALLGMLAGAAFGGRFGAPAALDPTVWNVIVPGMDEDVVSPDVGRGTSVLGGQLIVAPHAFRRADRISPRDGRAIGRVEIELAPDSGLLTVCLRAKSSNGTSLENIGLRPDAWSDMLGGGTHPHTPGTPFVITEQGGILTIDGTPGPPQPFAREPGTIELTADTEEAHVRAIRLYDTAGERFVDASWPGWVLDPVALLAGAAFGAIAGLVVAQRRGVPLVLALLAPVALVIAVPHQGWLALVERLFLVRATTRALATISLIVACAPMLATALLRSGVLVPVDARRGDFPRSIWAIAVLATAAFASRDGASWLVAIPGTLLLAAPLYVATRAGFGTTPSFHRDLPALLAVGLLGWGPGLLVATLWRFLLVAAAASTLLQRAPKLGADVLFVLVASLPVVTEAAIRDTWLGEAWDADRLAGREVGLSATDTAKAAEAFWSGACGAGDRARNVYFFGGSSTGGAYQMEGQPEAFFPAIAHRALCASLPSGALHTWNFGGGGRDSFTVSRGLDGYLAHGAPDVVVLYLGVNDLLTQNSGMTRKQREERMAERGKAARSLASVASRSRLIAGIGLLFRPVTTDDAARVSDVPLPDAEENLRRIAEVVTRAGGRVLLAPELTDLDTARRMELYRSLEKRLGDEIPGVTYVDLTATLHPESDDTLLFDRNHLTRSGHERVAALLAPAIASALTTDGAPAASATP